MINKTEISVHYEVSFFIICLHTLCILFLLHFLLFQVSDIEWSDEEFYSTISVEQSCG